MRCAPLLLLFAPGCLATSEQVLNADARAAAAEARAVALETEQERIANAQAEKLAGARAANETLRADVARLNDELNVMRADQRRFADSTLLTVRELKGKLEELGFNIKRFETDLEKQAEADRKAAEEAAKNVARQQPAGTLIERPRDQKEFYHLVRKLYTDKNYNESRLLAAEFAAKWPGGNLTDDVRFTIGESYLDERNYTAAIDAYRQVLVRHPEGDMVPFAMYKIGVCFESLGDRKAAQEFYGEVIKTYPDSKAAEQARPRYKPASDKPPAKPDKKPAGKPKPAPKKPAAKGKQPQ